MKRLLTSAAMSLVLATGAYAASDGDVLSDHAYQAASDFYVSDLIGMRVHVPDLSESAVAAGGGYERVGDINDIIVTGDGQAVAAIVGIGGFLGIGQKDVALDMAALEFRTDESGRRFIVVDTTREALEAAPLFARGDVVESESTIAATPTDATGSTMATTPPAGGLAAPPADETEAAGDGGGAATDDLAAERERLTAPEIERENYAAIPPEAVTAEALQGAVVYGPNDEEVGEIEELHVDASGAIENAVIDVGGFLGMGEKPVLVGMDELTILSDSEAGDVRVYIDSSKDALLAQPDFRG